MPELASTLILKLNAAGDVLRTTPLLRRLPGRITWVTSSANTSLLEGLDERVHCLGWERRHELQGACFDLVINLEDELEVARFAAELRAGRRFGALLAPGGELRYTDEARGWFDMGLTSRHGKAAADRLKLMNRRSYQSLVFEGLGHEFRGEPYLLPASPAGTLHGDVALAPRSGPVWPMKNWAWYEELRLALQAQGLTVNVLPQRATLLEHVADVRNHRCLVSGDSLPMHIALGAGLRCVTLFTCTSPWEIHDYGLQTQLVSPRLEEFFYQRGFDERATKAIPLDAVLQATLDALRAAARSEAT